MGVERALRRRIIAIVWAALFAACSDSVGPKPVPRPAGLIVSNPVPAGALAGALAVGSNLDASPAASDSVAYVSLTPGTAPGGTTATVRRIGSVSSFTTPVFDGGFDPVPVLARAGDSIEVVINDAGGGVVRQMRLAVAAVRPPTIVRTQPPPHKKDHPLNAALVVVFSEPVAGATVTSASIHLLHGRDEVPGAPRFLDPSLGTGNLSVEFVPAAPLQAATTYELVVTPQIRDLTGDALASPDTVEFTTGQSLTGPAYAVRMSIDTTLVLSEGTTRQLTATVWDSAEHQLTSTPVTWSILQDQSQGPAQVATVSSTGLVEALSPGVVIVLAEAGQVGVGHTIVVPFPSPAGVTITPAHDTIGVGRFVALIPAVRDSLGRDMSQTIRSTCWHSSDSLVASFGSGQGSSCYAGYRLGIGVYGIDTGTVTITATVTVRPNVAFPVDTEVTGTTTLTVVPSLAKVILSPDTVRLVPFGTRRLGVTLEDSSGSVMSNYSVSRLRWRSDNPAVATADSTGLTVLVRTLAAGQASILATIDGVTGSARIDVGTVAFASVSAANSGTCGLTGAGAAWCWGDISQSVLTVMGSVVSDGPYAAPTSVAGGLAFSKLANGDRHACGLTASGIAYCWGNNANGQLGYGSVSSSGFDPSYGPVPLPVSGGLTLAAISAGGLHTCGITTEGGAYCWGGGAYGQLGDGTITYGRTLPAAVAGGLTFGTLSLGGGHSCGITTAGGTYCWGLNNHGQLGDSTTTDRTTPVAIVGGLTFAAVSAGGNHTCGLTGDGTAYCWGGNDFGQLGDATTTERAAPVAVVGGLTLAAVSAGAGHTCAVTGAGTAYCWGANYAGQLGDGTTTSRTSPVPVAGGLAFTSVSAGGAQSCGLATDGVLYCWGANGGGTGENTTTPVKVLGQP